MNSSTYDYIDWMDTYCKNRQLQIYEMPGGIDPFCFLRVPDFADKMLPATARHNIEEAQIVSCHIFCFNSFVNVAS